MGYRGHVLPGRRLVSASVTQPSFVPIAEADQVRQALRLQVPEAWVPDRPAEIRTPARLIRPGFGTPGPDQGFALRLARRMEEDLVLAEGEEAEDVVMGVALLASRRAGLFGRAPSIYDVTAGCDLWGFRDEAPADLVAERRRVFSAVSHNYGGQRALVDTVPEDVLRLAPDDIAGRPPGFWRADPGPA